MFFLFNQPCILSDIHLIIFCWSSLSGTNIYVVVPTMYKKSFDPILQVNNTYTISNFQVVLNDMLFKTSEHNFLLKFINGKIVGDVNKHEIPAKAIKFTSFEYILAGRLKKDMLIGMVFVSILFLTFSSIFMRFT